MSADHSSIAGMRHVSDVLRKFFLSSDIEHVRLGFQDLDLLINGLGRSTLTVIAGFPGTGRSALALGIARNTAVLQKSRVLFFSFQMSVDRMHERLLCAESGVANQRLNPGQQTEMEERRIIRATDTLSKSTIEFVDGVPWSIGHVERIAHDRALQSEVDLVVVDGVELISFDDVPKLVDGRADELAPVWARLRLLAREIDVPVLCTTGLNAPLNRWPPVPKLSDLAAVGLPEELPDGVWFLTRPELHIGEAEWHALNPNLPPSAYPKGVVEVIVAKHRHGPTGTAELRFREHLAKFEDWVHLRDEDQE